MGRTPCCDKEGLKKGPWTSDEDQKLIEYINNHGPGNWRTLPNKAGLQRCGKSCRLRWANYLRPDIKRGKFSFEEEQTIIQLHSVLGNRWSAIAARLPGRTDNEIKNYYNTHIRRKLLRMGIDPMTHGPRLDHLNVPSLFSTLQNSSLLNIPAVVHNLQNNLLNLDLLKLATSLASSQTGLPNSYTQTPSINNMLINNPDDQIKSIIQNMPSSSNGLICSAIDHHNVAFSSINHSNHQSFSNGSSFATALSTLSSNPTLHPLDSAYTYLNSNISNEDEIDSYFMVNSEEKKLESPVLQ